MRPRHSPHGSVPAVDSVHNVYTRYAHYTNIPLSRQGRVSRICPSYDCPRLAFDLRRFDLALISLGWFPESCSYLGLFLV